MFPIDKTSHKNERIYPVVLHQSEIEKERMFAIMQRSFELQKAEAELLPLQSLHEVTSVEDWLESTEVESSASDVPSFSFRSKYLALERLIRNPRLDFEGIVAVQDESSEQRTFSVRTKSDKPFAIHSLGKIFTGVLILRLIQKGKIRESDLKKPIQLSEDVWNLLPKKIKDHLKENQVTLLQLMHHEGGLGEYLDKYIQEIKGALQKNEKPSQIKKPEDFLKYAETDTSEVGKFRYSNLGLLLVGLSVAHVTHKPFDTLMKEFVLNEAGMERFSSQKPEDAIFNTEDPIAPHITGGPAGGYWTTAQDILKFGSWISKQYKDANFKKLMENYGQEFYAQDKIYHDGQFPTSSVEVNIYPKHRTTIFIMSNKEKPNAVDVGAIIEKNLLKS